MISKMDNDVTLCKMGDGTLFSGVFRDQNGEPRGIAFTKTPNDIAGGVAFQIDNIEGFTGFMLPVIALMEEWQKAGFIAGSEEELKEFFEGIAGLKETLEPFKPKAK
ncbi:hypothetical protein [Planomicrobium sp. CPCC 101079]|uniref:hypothetical protein n=1 Tax=Planomicrobium sp. CPCC 101079 TaxID=2599618 RepID=UPI0011B4C354|nr:hypothetical protein [Planomicrobium sp. CPCC 101079]TWT04635.1 hypothetical protein FQV28_08515 [Planomicrobium sp. CPCC 101079]